MTSVRSVPLSPALGVGRVGQTPTRAYGTGGTRGTAGTIEQNGPRVLIPFDRREGITIEAAADLTGRDVRTIRRWCVAHSIGRRVAGGRPWVVSRVALSMLLNDDWPSLRSYLKGDRQSACVVAYYEQAGLADLTQRWAALHPFSESRAVASY